MSHGLAPAKLKSRGVSTVYAILGLVGLALFVLLLLYDDTSESPSVFGYRVPKLSTGQRLGGALGALAFAAACLLCAVFAPRMMHRSSVALEPGRAAATLGYSFLAFAAITAWSVALIYPTAAWEQNDWPRPVDLQPSQYRIIALIALALGAVFLTAAAIN